MKSIWLLFFSTGMTVFYIIAFCSVVLSQDTLPGKLVSIGYHRLYVTEKIAENPACTILFESGAGGTSGDWKKVINLLPGNVRIIAYDRAGYGKGEKGPLPRTMAQEVFELHALLQKEKIKGPLILVGQSLGGMLVRMYTAQYPKEVEGIVLVDPAHESGMLGSMRYGGWVRLREKAIGTKIPSPQLQQVISSGYDSTADYMAEEFQLLYNKDSINKVALGNRPLIVLGAGIRKQPPGTPDEQWAILKAERNTQVEGLTKLSANSKYILVENAGHYIHYDKPAIVAQSIEEVINAIKSKTKL